MTVPIFKDIGQDGRKIDSSRDRGQPFQFNIGRQEVMMSHHHHHHHHHYHPHHHYQHHRHDPALKVIAGWDEGVAKMSKGQRAKLTISADMGYGANGVPGQIPGGATLVFDVELINVS